MKMTRAVGYALRALTFLVAEEGDRPVASHEIAAAEGIPERFLLKMLRPLVRAGLLVSGKGPGGGYRLARPPGRISLLEVVEAVDGPIRGQAPSLPGGEDLNHRLQVICNEVAGQCRRLLRKVSVSDLASGPRKRGGRKRV